MAKRGSVEAFKEAEARRQERIKSPKASNMSDARKQKRDAFNAKVKSINESRVNKSSLDRFRKAEADRKARVASVNKMNPNSPKAKRLRAQADVEKDLPKAKTTTAAASPMAKDRVASAVGAATSTAGKVASKPIAAPKGETSTSKKSADLSGFGAAFKKARAEGVGTKFAYNDKMYSAVTKDDISRAGKSSLQDFLNSTKRSETKIAKAPGQREEAIVKKQTGGMTEDSTSRQKNLKISLDKLKERLKNRSMMDRPKNPRKKMGGNSYTRDYFKPELKERMIRDSGAAVTDNEMRSMMDQMGKTESMDRFKSGGSVMARGCKLGRKKPTKIY